MNKYRVILLGAFLGFWAVFGGVLIGQGAIPLVLLLSIAVLSVLAVFDWVNKNPIDKKALVLPVFVFLLAIVVSIAKNGFTGYQAFFYGAGVLVFMLSAQDLQKPLSVAAWVWLVGSLGMIAAGYFDDRNLIGYWGAFFALLMFARRGLWRITSTLPFVGMLVLSGSRGAVIAMGAGLVALYWPQLWARKKLLFSVGAVSAIGLAALVLLRVGTSNSRLYYWEASTQLFFTHPLAGVGPGGILSQRLIPDVGVHRAYISLGLDGQMMGSALTELQPGSEGLRTYAPHAHNLFFQVLAEMGLVGMAALAFSGWWLWRKRTEIHLEGWQRATIAAALAHSMVDLPLWWFGPLLVFMAVLGSVKTENKP